MRRLVVIAIAAACVAPTWWIARAWAGDGADGGASVADGGEADGGAGVRAEGDDPERQLHREAKALYDQDRFDLAAARFEESYRRYHKPLYLFNQAQSHRSAGACSRAREAYARYLAIAAADDPNRERAARYHAEMQRCETATPARAGTTAKVESLRSGRPKAQKETLMTERRHVPVAASTGAWLRPSGLSLVAAGVVASAGAAIFAWQGKRAADELNGGNISYGDRSMQLERDGHRDNRLAIGFAVAAAVAGSLGATLLFLAPDSTPHSGGSTVQGAIAVISGRF